METENRVAAAGLNQQLTSVRSFSFFQLANLLDRFVALNEQLEKDPVMVRYRAKPSLGFPAADVDNCTFLQDGVKQFLEVTVTFLGLYGPASPLPAFYTERIIQSNDPRNASRDLMDLFNHRCISLLQNCWEKYRYYSRYQPDGRDQYSRWLLGMLGVDIELLRHTTQLRWHKLLPFAGVMLNNVCSGDLLARILKVYFNLPKVSIQPWVRRTVKIPEDQCNSVGRDNSCLGEDLILGREVEDYSGKFSLHLEALDWANYVRFLPDGQHFEELVQLVRFSLKDPLDFELHLYPAAQETKKIRGLTDAGPRLGWNLGLGEAHHSPREEKTVICVNDFTSF